LKKKNRVEIRWKKFLSLEPLPLQRLQRSSGMEYTDTQIAKVLDIDRTTAWRWRKAGMPNDDLEAAKAWAQNRKPKPTPALAEGIASSVAPDATKKVQEGENAYDVRDRLQAQERSIAAEITGLNAALEQARVGNDESAAYKLLQALKSAREEHRRQADSLLKAEGRIILLEKNRGDLISVSSAKDFVSKCIIPLTIWIRKLADAGRTSEEKGLLQTLREAGLEILRTSAKEALDFNGK
jgi:hypothetical protein